MNRSRPPERNLALVAANGTLEKALEIAPELG
jgi:hypothetical protein